MSFSFRLQGPVISFFFLFFYRIKQSPPSRNLLPSEVRHEFQRCSFFNSSYGSCCCLMASFWKVAVAPLAPTARPLAEHTKAAAISSPVLCLDPWGYRTHLGFLIHPHLMLPQRQGIARPLYTLRLWLCHPCLINTHLPLEKIHKKLFYFTFADLPYHFNSCFTRGVEQSSGCWRT